MGFIIDKQTLDDLNIFGKGRGNSVYGIFNNTTTRGGALILEDMFRYPLSDVARINQRSSVIRYFLEQGTTFPFRNEWFDTIEHYLSNRDNRTRLNAGDNTLQRKIRGAIGADTEYELLHKGVLAAIGIINGVNDFVTRAGEGKPGSPCQEEFRQMEEMIREPHLAWAVSEKGAKKITYEKMTVYDRLLRYEGHDLLKKLLYHIYSLDVYISVAAIARERGFVFAEALPGGRSVMKISGVYHPLVPAAIPNSMEVDGNQNVVFLTGANMAGKSTFMKAFGIAVFLAHMGFPLPAESMEFTVQKGMFTTINLPDNLNMGYSHFYAEVLRVKKVAAQVSKTENMVIIFDELFRGTNVKDAYEATVAVTKAFAEKRNCTFMISTHIIEAGEVLRESCPNINFTYLPTVMEGNTPVYTYRLESGITNDRHGMMIVNNEQVLEILKQPGPPEGKTVAPAVFTVDKQTLEDLNILGKFKTNSVFNVFNSTRTRGGERLLENMFRHPMTDAAEINHRSAIIGFFRRKKAVFPFDQEKFDLVERYLNNRAHPNRMVAFLNTCRRKFLHSIAKDLEYEMITGGLQEAVGFLNSLGAFNRSLAEEGSAYSGIREETRNLLHSKPLSWVFKGDGCQKLSLWKLAAYDYSLRHVCHSQLKRLLEIVYALDVYIAVAGEAEKKGFSQAVARPFTGGKNSIALANVFHPGLGGAVANDVHIDAGRNVIFLTGANMAGKSTLMKAFGIAVYLAHMGFPVAAGKMEFTVQDGLYTSINVPDNLNMGYSHFYAEVLRVKHVAEEVGSGKNLVVIFDELFKGTNVKDAYDATVAVTRAFSGHRNCSFIISTHITEAGHTLCENCSNFKFVYFPTVMEGRIPTYTYRLQEGITNDRHGMMIINNEHILEIIRGER